MKERLSNWSNDCIVYRDKSWTTSKSNNKNKVNNIKSSSNNNKSHCYRVLMMSYNNGKMVDY